MQPTGSTEHGGQIMAPTCCIGFIRNREGVIITRRLGQVKLNRALRREYVSRRLEPLGAGRVLQLNGNSGCQWSRVRIAV